MGDTRSLPVPMSQRSVFRRLWPWMLFLAVYSGVIAWLEYAFHIVDHVPVQMHALLGSVLGVLVIFRTNTAYDRWWEGRKLWGQLVNDSRNLSIKLRSLPGVSRDEARYCGRLLVNFARALKEHLRDGIRARQLSVYKTLETAAEPKHVPSHIALLVRSRVSGWRREGRIDGFDDLLLDPHLRALMDICGACERIRKTPISQSYRAFLRRCIGIYVVTLPFGLVEDLLFWTVPVAVIIAYFLVGLEVIAEDVEEPFGRGEDDLMLDDICRVLEATVEEILTDGEIKVEDVKAATTTPSEKQHV